jgi:hypothetical protein
LIEAFKDLKNEFLSETLEAEPNDVFRPLAKPLAGEATRDNEPDRDLKKEFFPARPEDEPSEMFRPLAKPLS